MQTLGTTLDPRGINMYSVTSQIQQNSLPDRGSQVYIYLRSPYVDQDLER